MKAATCTTLRFLGASGTVTGSRFLLETSAARALLDCGLFQGGRALRRRNWDPPPFEPQLLSAVLLSQAHLDHSGHLPVLVRRGFRGPVHCTAGTRDLLEVLLCVDGVVCEFVSGTTRVFRLNDDATDLGTHRDVAGDAP